MCLENFVDDDGNFKMNDSFVAFGVGRRDLKSCNIFRICFDEL